MCSPFVVFGYLDLFYHCYAPRLFTFSLFVTYYLNPTSQTTIIEVHFVLYINIYAFASMHGNIPFVADLPHPGFLLHIASTDKVKIRAYSDCHPGGTIEILVSFIEMPDPVKVADTVW